MNKTSLVFTRRGGGQLFRVIFNFFTFFFNTKKLLKNWILSFRKKKKIWKFFCFHEGELFSNFGYLFFHLKKYRSMLFFFSGILVRSSSPLAVFFLNGFTAKKTIFFFRKKVFQIHLKLHWKKMSHDNFFFFGWCEVKNQKEKIFFLWRRAFCFYTEVTSFFGLVCLGSAQTFPGWRNNLGKKNSSKM